MDRGPALLGVMIFGFFLLVHVPLVLGRPNEPDQITYLTQALTFSGMMPFVHRLVPDWS